MSKQNLVRVREAAEAKGVSQNTIRNWIARGVITGYRFGPSMLRVDLNELDRLTRPIPTVKPKAGAR